MKTTARTLALVLALVAASCGGSAEPEGGDTSVVGSDGTTQPETTQPETTQPDETTPPGDDAEGGSEESSGSSGVNTAVITIGDQTYEFEWERDAIQRCDPDFFGGFVANAATTSDEQSFESEFPPPDDPDLITPKVEVSDPASSAHWTADPEETAGTMFESWPAQIDSHQIDGNSVSGTATFVGPVVSTTGDSPEGVSGSFEITCAPED